MMSAQPLEIRMARLEGVYEQIDKRVGDLAASTAAGFARVDARLDRLQSRLDIFDSKVNLKFDSLQWRMTSLIVGAWLSTIATILLKH